MMGSNNTCTRCRACRYAAHLLASGSQLGKMLAEHLHASFLQQIAKQNPSRAVARSASFSILFQPACPPLCTLRGLAAPLIRCS